jgi:hypothetical protein
MLVIVGLIALLAAAIVGVPSSAGAGHPLTDFSVHGYHLTGSTGTLFLFGIAVGAVASLGLCLLLTGTQTSFTHVIARESDDARSTAGNSTQAPPI